MIEVYGASSATLNASVSTVYINGQLEPRLRCTTIEVSVGPVPGKAYIMLGSTTTTEKSPRTLMSTNDYERWKFGSRVIVESDGSTAFLGTMMQRQDSGINDAPMWVAYDDKWLLSKLPVRGCFVADYDQSDPPVSQGLKYITRFLPHMNPQGWWNCMPFDDPNLGLIPMFAPYAEKRPFDYHTQFSQTFDKLEADKITCWTPRRALQYLQYVFGATDGPDGFTENRHRRSFVNSTRIAWPADFNIGDGTGGKGGPDPLDMKLQDCDLSGMNMLEAICQVLHLSGTHELGTEIREEEDKSCVAFYARQQDDSYNSGCEIYVRRGGTLAEANIAIDFDLYETAEKVAEAVLVEGNEYKLETQLLYDPDGKDTDNTIKPSWSTDDQRKFIKVIWGGDDGTTTNDWALIPSTDGGEPNVVCDGTNNRPTIEARSPGAMAYARQLYPDVFIEYTIQMTNLVNQTIRVLYGVNQEFQATDDYPIVMAIRQCFEHQLTKMSIGNTKLFQQYPVRIQVKDGNLWYDSPFLNGFMPGGKTVRIQGLAENLEGAPEDVKYCLYNGTLRSDNPFTKVTPRGVKINLSIPLDHRIEGYKEVGVDCPSQLDPSLTTEFGGRVMDAELNPGYLHEYRMNSYTKPQPDKMSDIDLESNQADITWAATKALARRKRTEKRSNWIFPGINLSYTPGRWVNSIKVVGGSANDVAYSIQAIIPSVVYDFLNQTTRVGGIIHYMPAPKPVDESQTDVYSPNGNYKS
jgi:hypothetical protein